MTQTKLTSNTSLTGKWKSYPSYKDSNIKWVGKIPVTWQVMRLKYIAHLCYGDSLPADARSEGEVPVFGSNGPVGFHSEPNTLAPALVIGRKGSFGKITFSDQPCFAIDTTYFIDVRNSKVNLRWLFYALLPLRLDAISEDSAVPGLSRELTEEQWLPVMPLPEQLAIAAFLDHKTARINALIAKKERLIEPLQEKRAALISHAVTKGLDPTVPMKDSGVEWLGEVPSHWEVKRLRFVADVLTGVAKGRDLGQKDVVEIPYLRVANVQDGYLDLADIATIIVGVDEVERYSLKYGDVLMNEGGDFDKLGRGYVWEEIIAPCLHQNHVFAVRPHFGVNPYWISIITLTSYAKHYFILKSKQSTNLASISGTNLKELPVLMPPEDELNEIMLYTKDATAKIDALISRIRGGIEKLREYSTALISSAVTGKIDVRGEIASQDEMSISSTVKY